MKGGYRKCENFEDKSNVDLRERCIVLKGRIDFLEDDRDFWHKNSAEYRKQWLDEFDMRLKASRKAEKWKKLFIASSITTVLTLLSYIIFLIIK